MMKIQTLVLGQLETNCYLAWDEKTHDAIIIDPAEEGGFIIQKILDLKLRPKLIIATHGHFDHILAATELKLAFNIPFLMHKTDLFLLNRTEDTAKHFLGTRVDPPPTVDQFLKENDEINFGSEKLKIIETPGHTPGSICLYTKGFLFSGDTLFQNGDGRTDLAYSSHTKLIESLHKILRLPEITAVFPGHGEATTIKDEKINIV